MKNVFPITFIDRLIKKHELRQPFRLTGTRMYQRAVAVVLKSEVYTRSYLSSEKTRF